MVYSRCMAKKKADTLSPAEIRALRLRLKLTLQEAAEKVGVAWRTWYGWELKSQKRKPSPSHVILLRLLEKGLL